MTELVRAPRGGKLAFECWGPASGTPVVLMHGSPGSREGPRPRRVYLDRIGVRLISYDRPGYGDSDRQAGRGVFHAAEDVEAIAEHLGLDGFAVVGRSGGGPHAMACAALLPHLVTKVAVLVSLAPADAEGLNWYGGMGTVNVSEYRSAERDSSGALNTLIEQASQIRDDPESLLRTLEEDLSLVDRRIVNDLGIRQLLLKAYGEALKHNGDGWLDDVLAFRRPWGFQPAEIKAPMLLWHGADDKFSPVAHTRWLAAQVPHAETWVERGASHFSAVEVLPSILSWIVDPAPTAFAERRIFARD